MKIFKRLTALAIVIAFIISAFPLPVALAEGEDYETIELNKEIVVTVNEESDGKKVFRFVAEEEGEYNFFSFNTDLDTKGYLYNSDMQQIAFDDDTDNRNFLITCSLSAGEEVYFESSTWYRNEYGNYSVMITKLQSATAISFSESEIVGKIGEKKDISVVATPENAVVGELVWEIADDSKVKISATNGNTCTITLVGAGETTLTATSSNGVFADCIVKIEEAEIFSVGETKTIITTEENFGEAFYKFVPQESGKYKFCSFDNSYDTYGHIYNSNMDELYFDDDTGGNRNFSISFQADAGKTYYIKSRPYSTETSGEYSISVTRITSLEAITLSKENIQGEIGYNSDIELSFYPESAEGESIIWSIANESIARRNYSDNNCCNITLIKQGATTLTATSESGITATCEITVAEPSGIKEGKVIEENIEENTYSKTYKFIPEENGIYRFEEKINNATYKLNLWDEDFNHISSYNCMEIELTAGEVYYYNISAEKSEKENNIELSLVVKHLVVATGIILSTDYVQGNIAEYQTIYATFLPENAIEENISWQIADESVAEIYDTGFYGEECQVKFVGGGSTTLTATSASGYRATCEINVTQPIDIGEGEHHTRYADEGYKYTYKFIPEETGTYTLDFVSINSGVEWVGLYDGTISWQDDFEYELTEGKTYYFIVKGYVDYREDNGDGSYITIYLNEEKELLLGDLNEDSKVDVIDYQLLVNLTVLNENNIIDNYGYKMIEKADINKDEVVDVLDAWALSLIINQKQ